MFDKRKQGFAARINNQDQRSGFTILRLIDPLYWLSLSCSFFLLRNKYKLNQAESLLILENVAKHRIVLWVNLVGGYVCYTSLLDMDINQLNTIANILLAPAFITGGAWFAITFGGVPNKLLDIALMVTFWLLSAFSLSLTMMGIVLFFVVDGNIPLLMVILFINFSVILAAIMYDNIDCLKIGLDEALKGNSLANMRYLKKYYNIIPPEEGQNLYDDLSSTDNN